MKESVAVFEPVQHFAISRLVEVEADVLGGRVVVLVEDRPRSRVLRYLFEQRFRIAFQMIVLVPSTGFSRGGSFIRSRSS